jgi:acylphosphatase
MNKKAVIKVYGKVQGVFFRVSTREKGRRLGLNSCEAENMSDGTVRIVAEGDEHMIQKLVDWCRAGGPEYAEVEKVGVEFIRK